MSGVGGDDERIVGDCLTFIGASSSKRLLRRGLKVVAAQTFETMADAIAGHVSSAFDVDRSQARVRTKLDAELGIAASAGRPAEFVDRVALAHYAVGRLRCRARYLFKLMTSDVPETVFARARLSSATPEMARDHPVLRVASLGGGPGFDHIAVETVAALFASLKGFDCENAVRIETTIFDLYADAWAPFVDAVREGCELNPTRNPKNALALQPCDLRKPATSPQNDRFKSHITVTDLFLFSFVLHENAAFIVSRDGTTVIGLVKDILVGARIGACVLCMDAGHTLWPALVNTASAAGWTATARDDNDDNDKKNSGGLGPRSYCCLHRRTVVDV